MNHNHTQHTAPDTFGAFLCPEENVTTYYQDASIELHHGDALTIAGTLPSGSVASIITSPPYYGLRDYGQSGQYGLEETPEQYAETMRALFAELRRVLADDGTFWLNIGDSYGKGKQLMGIPWRVAFALQSDGWIIRNDIIWAKPNPMPESVKDRMARSHEHVFLFSKKTKYYFDTDAVAEPLAPSSIARLSQNVAAQTGSTRANGGAKTNGNIRAAGNLEKGTRNRRDVWNVTTQPFKEAHFATMPPELARICVLAGSRPGGTILDPFSGSGTTGMVAKEEGRKYVGIDINADYLKLSLGTRLQNAALDFGGAA